MLKKIKEIAIVALLLLIIWGVVKKPNIITTTSTTTVDSIVYNYRDTLIATYTEYDVPRITYDTVWSHQDLPLDSGEIVKDWLSKIAYSDSIINNEDLLIIIRDTLQFNRKQSSNVTYFIRRPDKTIYQTTTITNTESYRFNVGLDVYSTSDLYVGVGLYKNKWLYNFYIEPFKTMNGDFRAGIGARINF